ncbi:MAG: hypothetical protein K2F77_07750, partial [Muribaculaceae bacterium]|nr:hypothetical protein [Muribaculaceae bacterium]
IQRLHIEFSYFYHDSAKVRVLFLYSFTNHEQNVRQPEAGGKRGQNLANIGCFFYFCGDSEKI